MSRDAHDILLVDDEAELLLTVGELLRTHGFNVLIAQDASRALEQLENKVGMIILDVNLAGENGLQLMDFLKANQPHIPIILYTGLAHDDEQVKTMLQRGAACYVSKVQPIQGLIYAIRELQGKSGRNS